MNHKQKVGYITLGAVIMLIGMGIGSTFFPPPLTAQQNGVSDEITCRKLTVVDDNGQVKVSIDTALFGGEVWVRGKEGEIAAIMTALEHGGIVEVNGKDGNRAAGMTVTPSDGGRINVFNNQGKTRASMGVNEWGNGGVATWDKNGFRRRMP